MEGFFIVLGIIILIVAIKSFKVVTQSEVMIIERLGKYLKTATAGLNIIIPFLDRVRATVSLKEQTMDVQPQSVITKDNVTSIGVSSVKDINAKTVKFANENIIYSDVGHLANLVNNRQDTANSNYGEYTNYISGPLQNKEVKEVAGVQTILLA